MSEQSAELHGLPEEYSTRCLKPSFFYRVVVESPDRAILHRFLMCPDLTSVKQGKPGGVKVYWVDSTIMSGSRVGPENVELFTSCFEASDFLSIESLKEDLELEEGFEHHITPVLENFWIQ